MIIYLNQFVASPKSVHHGAVVPQSDDEERPIKEKKR